MLSILSLCTHTLEQDRYMGDVRYLLEEAAPTHFTDWHVNPFYRLTCGPSQELHALPLQRAVKYGSSVHVLEDTRHCVCQLCHQERISHPISENFVTIKSTKLLKRTGVLFPVQRFLEVCNHSQMPGSQGLFGVTESQVGTS